MNGIADSCKTRISVGPAKKVVASGGSAAAGFDDRDTGQQTPIDAVSIRFGDEYFGVCLVGAMVLPQELAKLDRSQTGLFIALREVQIGLRSDGGDSENSCKNQTRLKKALH